MPCFNPIQGFFSVRPDGKKDFKGSNVLASLFSKNVKSLTPDSSLSVPCGRCMGCRVERSRQWAVRIMHEASLYDDNCFLTLTFDDEHLVKMCPDLSLDRKHMQDFMKRLRQRFDDRKIRVYYCGEYGDDYGRPHYHLCLFNLDFEDKVHWKNVGDFPYYNSKILSELWTFGHSVISDLTFDSAAYVARYCTKKITGDAAKDHYGSRLPEFGQASLKPGIGRDWYDKFGMSDIFPRDECVVNGVITKPPRYYDKRLEVSDPCLYEKIKLRRKEQGMEKVEDNTHDRLIVKEKCMNAKMKCLVRKLEVSND